MKYLYRSFSESRHYFDTRDDDTDDNCWILESDIYQSGMATFRKQNTNIYKNDFAEYYEPEDYEPGDFVWADHTAIESSKDRLCIVQGDREGDGQQYLVKLHPSELAPNQDPEDSWYTLDIEDLKFFADRRLAVTDGAGDNDIDFNIYRKELMIGDIVIFQNKFMEVTGFSGSTNVYMSLYGDSRTTFYGQRKDITHLMKRSAPYVRYFTKSLEDLINPRVRDSAGATHQIPSNIRSYANTGDEVWVDSCDHHIGQLKMKRYKHNDWLIDIIITDLYARRGSVRKTWYRAWSGNQAQKEIILAQVLDRYRREDETPVVEALRTPTAEEAVINAANANRGYNGVNAIPLGTPSVQETARRREREANEYQRNLDELNGQQAATPDDDDYTVSEREQTGWTGVGDTLGQRTTEAIRNQVAEVVYKTIWSHHIK